MDNKWSGSECDLLSQHPEQDNVLATSTGICLIMLWSVCGLVHVVLGR